MNSNNGKDKEDFEQLVESFLRQGDLDERIEDLLAAEIDRGVGNEEFSLEFSERARAAVVRGMFDGSIARGRAGMSGSLGTFGTALRRIREAAGRSLEQMAERASVSPELWALLEDQRFSPGAMDVGELASVVEAAQLRQSELRAALRRTESVRLVPGGQASFRTDPSAASDAAASYEDLVSAVAEDSAPEAGEGSEDAINFLVERVADELRQRGRKDLL